VPSIRARIEAAWGARVIDHWGMTEVGPLASECVENPGGQHILETECLAEIIDPATGQPFDLDAAIAAGPQAGTKPTRGELVITNFGRVGSPVIRYRTGDLVELDPSPCPCGRSWLRLKGGIQDRLDDMLTIRGNNVFPTAIEAILREFPEIIEYRFNVANDRAMQSLKIELETTLGVPQAPDAHQRQDDLLVRVAAAIHDRLHFQPELLVVAPGSLPRHEMKGRRLQRDL
jgi:phenylacetate-CoA ligase